MIHDHPIIAIAIAKCINCEDMKESAEKLALVIILIDKESIKSQKTQSKIEYEFNLAAIIKSTSVN